jgi:hypothetical protein
MLGSPIGDYYISPIDPGLNQFPGADGNKPAASDQRLFFHARSFAAPSG